MATWSGAHAPYKVTYSATGVYQGDWLTHTDFNKYFRDNLLYLQDLCNQLFPSAHVVVNIPEATLGAIATTDMFNGVEQGIYDIATASQISDKVSKPIEWSAGDHAPTFADLNRYSNDILTLYNHLSFLS